MKNVLPRFAFALLAVLVIAAVLLTLGQRESQAHPSAGSYNPSGLHAFYTLLQQNGVPVVTERGAEIPATATSGRAFEAAWACPAPASAAASTSVVTRPRAISEVCRQEWPPS